MIFDNLAKIIVYESNFKVRRKPRASLRAAERKPIIKPKTNQFFRMAVSLKTHITMIKNAISFSNNDRIDDMLTLLEAAGIFVVVVTESLFQWPALT